MSDVIMSSRITRRRNVRNGVLVVLGLFVTVFVFTFLIQLNHKSEMEVKAASLDGFDAGYIISDWQMGNYNSMSEAEIQNFLTSKNSCGNRDYDYYLRLSRNSGYQWHWKDDHFVCLSEELFGDGETIGWGDTAAHILWQTAQDYRINPQALIVLWQKETGLITDPIPNNGDYRKATGYGCPDTAPCSSEYYGFKNQVRRAAALFRTVLDGGWTNYPLGENYIQYNPNPDCGGSVVNVRSLATSALYRYTPYQPNQGAIDAGYGTAYCGAYGNRNFYLYFQDWFGGITNDYEEKLGRTIPDGKYQITLKNNSYKSLDIRGGIYDGMKYEKIIAFDAKAWGASNQTFEINYNQSTGYYNIFNRGSGLYVDIDDDNVVVREKNENCGQNWNIYRGEDGYYNIASSCNGKVLTSNEQNAIIDNSNELRGSTIWRMREISAETHSLKDGIYQIVTSMSDDRVLDVDVSKNKLELWSRKKANDWVDNQLFEIKYNDDFGYYTIVNLISGLSLDVYKGFTEDRTRIIAWNKNGGCNQQWMIRKSSDEDFEIISMCSGKNIDIFGGEISIGQDIILFTKNGGKNQKWKFESVPEAEYLSGEFLIESKKDDHLVIDVSGGVYPDQRSGEAIIFGKKDKNYDNQLFVIEKTESDNKNEYYIYNKASKLYLDVRGGNDENNTQVIFWPYHGACNQRWIIDEKEDYYTITSACNNKALDVDRGLFANGTHVIMYTKHDGINQRWTLHPM